MPSFSATIFGGESPRLDVLLSKQEGFSKSRSFAQKIIEEGLVLVNGKPAKPSLRIKDGDVVEYTIPEAEPMEALPQAIPLDIIYEDHDIVVINKPRGMVVHPAAGNYTGTLVNALLSHCKDLRAIGDKIRPGIVHRLDKDTTGVLVVAKNEDSLRSLQAQIKARSAKRVYIAVVVGAPPESGTVDAPIGRDPHDRKKMAIVAGGRPAVTHFWVMERKSNYALLRLELETGRTHQIRVHMAHKGFPILQDSTYGSSKPRLRLTGQALHACELRLLHPRTGEMMRFSAPIPQDMLGALQDLGFSPPSAC